MPAFAISGGEHTSCHCLLSCHFSRLSAYLPYLHPTKRPACACRQTVTCALPVGRWDRGVYLYHYHRHCSWRFSPDSCWRAVRLGVRRNLASRVVSVSCLPALCYICVLPTLSCVWCACFSALRALLPLRHSASFLSMCLCLFLTLPHSSPRAFLLLPWTHCCSGREVGLSWQFIVPSVLHGSL